MSYSKLLAVFAMLAVAPVAFAEPTNTASFPVTITVDAAKPVGKLKPICFKGITTASCGRESFAAVSSARLRSAARRLAIRRSCGSPLALRCSFLRESLHF